MAAGVVMLVMRMFVMGGTAIGAGTLAMYLARILAVHWWILPVALVIAIGLLIGGVVEWQKFAKYRRRIRDWIPWIGGSNGKSTSASPSASS